MLHVHRAERADRLADGLAGILADPLEDPFAADVVAVPTRGIERWLAQGLSTRLGASPGRADGVCANVEFPFPGRLIVGALAAASGIEPEEDPWLPERAVWPLLDVVDACLEEPWLAILKQHLEGARGAPEEPPRRFGVVRHLADLFDRYGIHRPAMVRAWADGAEPDHWQPELWRRLRARIGLPSVAERLVAACERLRDEPTLLELPPRLALFGLTRLPASYLDVLGALAHAREVHLFILHPSPALWSWIAERGDRRPGGGERMVPRQADPTAALPANRLLASWGRDARELQLVLGGAAPGVDHHHEVPAPAQTLLSRIQADIRADRPPPGAPLPGQADLRTPLDPGDRSVEVHSCHGRARQVEVLRDAVLHLLADDPTLEPRDVIVMCPDIEVFAPLVQATFGAGWVSEDGHDGALPDLRVRLADRSLRQTNPVLGVVSQLLALADQRASASQLLDLAAREPVRRRFGFDDDDLSRMQEWVAASGIRWGFDAAHRAPFKLSALKANTWRAGLDRILAGVAMAEDDRRLIAGVLPLDDVESGAIDLAGRMAEYVDRLRTALDELTGAKRIDAWARAIGRAADALTDTRDRDAWQPRELQRLLDDTVAAADDPGGTKRGELELADVRALLADRLRGRPTRANFRTGHLTVCTLVPMRSVPHRVICVLGLDDGEFPRRARRDGDDLMLEDPHVGDRDPRSEDRQMLLDALMAATERLIITYTGHDERTNLPRPPAVPVGELLDTIERTAGEEARRRVEVCHPLQPFDPRNFTTGRLLPGRPWGFDPHALAGARALTGPRADPAAFLPEPLPPLESPLLELAKLERFVEHPARALLRDRLGIGAAEYFDEIVDALPVELDGLAEWGVGQRLLEGLLAGAEIETCVAAERARGSLPPGELARPLIKRVGATARRLAAEAAALGHEPADPLDVNVALPDGRTLAGTVAGVCGDTVRSFAYSRVSPRVRLRAWVRLLALTAARPERAFASLVIGRARPEMRSAELTVARIAPLADTADGRRDAALAHLAVLIDLYDRGTREPLPLTCEASAAYAQAVATGGDGEAAARSAWETVFRPDKEDRQPEHVLVFGEAVPFSKLLEEAPRADERGEGWEESEATRFGRYALRLWGGLLSHEELVDR